MRTPTVTEVPGALEPATRDPFIDDTPARLVPPPSDPLRSRVHPSPTSTESLPLPPGLAPSALSADLAAAVGRDRHRSSGSRRHEFVMTWPTVTELPGRLESVSQNTFIDGL